MRRMRGGRLPPRTLRPARRFAVRPAAGYAIRLSPAASPYPDAPSSSPGGAPGRFPLEDDPVRRFALPLFLLALLAGPARADTSAAAPKLDTGDTAWMLGASGLVLLMVPGLALFYGGMVRRKNVLGTMMHSMVALALVGVQWILLGYCLAFGASQGGWFGWSPEYLGLSGVPVAGDGSLFPKTSIPVHVHCMFQGMFAIITPALISGALAERIRFLPYCLFVLLWTTLVYDPLAHWMWAVDAKGDPVGWLGKMGALDFAGGTVVHIAAGFSALAALLLLPKRRGYPEHAMHPNSMVLTLTGAGLLWFGWFGFNGGSALGASAQAVLALAASQCAAAAAAVSWMVAELVHRGKPTALGLASGLVAGLVAVTPASGFVSPLSALVIGAVAGVVCYVAVYAKTIFKHDDSLDAFGVHGVGGLLGAILTGVFASYALWGAATGAKPGEAMGVVNAAWPAGLVGQVWVQLVAAAVAAGFGFAGTVVLVKAIDATLGFSLPAEDEEAGTDRSEHGEVGFDHGLGGTLDEVPETRQPEPKAAAVPPNGAGRFTVIVEGPSERELMAAWSRLCQAGTAHPPEFRKVYPLLTTVKGNRFHFRGGDHFDVKSDLQRLFESALNTTVHAHVEE
ncbi:MAG: ammonium transporter [Gemmataceae bacterium]|nr:ammonium transporter [Gemmataceae bacterium]